MCKHIYIYIYIYIFIHIYIYIFTLLLIYLMLVRAFVKTFEQIANRALTTKVCATKTLRAARTARHWPRSVARNLGSQPCFSQNLYIYKYMYIYIYIYIYLLFY